MCWYTNHLILVIGHMIFWWIFYWTSLIQSTENDSEWLLFQEKRQLNAPRYRREKNKDIFHSVNLSIIGTRSLLYEIKNTCRFVSHHHLKCEPWWDIFVFFFLVFHMKQKTLCCKFCLINLILLHIKLFTARLIRATIKAKKKMPFSTHAAYIWISQSETENSNTKIKKMEEKQKQRKKKQKWNKHRNRNDRRKDDSDKQQISKPFNKRNAKWSLSRDILWKMTFFVCPIQCRCAYINIVHVHHSRA